MKLTCHELNYVNHFESVYTQYERPLVIIYSIASLIFLLVLLCKSHERDKKWTVRAENSFYSGDPECTSWFLLLSGTKRIARNMTHLTGYSSWPFDGPKSIATVRKKYYLQQVRIILYIILKIVPWRIKVRLCFTL